MKLRGLYAIVDTGTIARAGLDPLTFAADVLAARPAALQLRAKGARLLDIVRLARELGAMCRDAGVPFVVNDHPDVAMDVGASLVHLGQDDDVPADASLGIGRSTHSLEQLANALESKPAYVAFGPVFATASKANPDPVVGLDGLAAARAALSASVAPETPLVAIGGISLENAAKIAEIADAGAVIGALVASDVTARARELHALLGGAS